MKLRVLEAEWTPFVDALRRREDVETAGVVMAQPVGHDVLVTRRLLLVPDEGYAVRRSDQLRIDPVALNRLVRPAREQGLSIFTVHTHPGTEQPWFSGADDDGDARLMPSFYVQAPGPHGSLVVAGKTGATTARIWTQEAGPARLAVRVVGHTLTLVDSHQPATNSNGWFDRQVLALGSDGQRALRHLRVGVVGLGGTGSVCLLQLAHLGVDAITLVDGDIVESSNVSRILGSTASDAGRTAKADVAARYVRRLGLGANVQTLRGDLGRNIHADQLLDCDVILSCVDRHTPRAILNRLSYEHLIPLIDMGTGFRVNRSQRITSGAGRVVVVGPGRPCLACWGHIDSRQLTVEALPETERTRQGAEGYIQNADVPEPSVVAFNTAVAGAALVELLRLTTKFAGADDPPNRLSFDFTTASVRRNRLSNPRRCSICGRHRGQGTEQGRGMRATGT